jgi:tetratricopeptide (TPR) repeat protein
VAAALALAAAGCSTVGNGVSAMKGGVASSSGGSTAANAAPARPAPPVYDTPVAPATQRAFDDASRALRSGRVDEAERAYKALAQANPELGGPHANLGVIYRQAGKVNEAIAELEQAVKLSPRQPIYLNQLGVAYRQQGQFAKARDAYQRALALDPGYTAAMLNLGILYDMYLGDTQRALELYGRYLSLLPNGDPTVTKWVADLKNRKPGPITVSRQEKP